ncbi:MAG: hypothetical protein JW749_05940 [Sedimentisphaerales bacterium]|nr:hypothetical protein [Sedimentisphaerales bacterium]
MRSEELLYVSGAEGIIDNVSEARRFVLENGYSIIASTDWHRESNKEISDRPDFKKTFPLHCMAGSPGSERVGYLGEMEIDIVAAPLIPILPATMQTLPKSPLWASFARGFSFGMFSIICI